MRLCVVVQNSFVGNKITKISAGLGQMGVASAECSSSSSYSDGC
jgi:hypothetical protein